MKKELAIWTGILSASFPILIVELFVLHWTVNYFSTTSGDELGIQLIVLIPLFMLAFLIGDAIALILTIIIILASIIMIVINLFKIRKIKKIKLSKENSYEKRT